MHEASLVQGLLSLALKAVEDHNRAHPQQRGAKIKEIICGAGLLACFEIETLKACFEIFAEGTVAEGAVLQIDVMPLDCVCSQCGKNFQLTERHFACPE